MTLFLCNWYKREELAVRISFLFSKYHCRISHNISVGKVS